VGVCVQTIQRWDQAEKLRTVRTAGNQRRIPLKEIERLLRPGEPQAERCVLYARASSVRQDQDGNLAQQTERLKAAASARLYEVVAVSVCAGRLYGHGAKQVRKQVKAALATCEQEEPTEPR
jgi:putative resolvase